MIISLSSFHFLAWNLSHLQTKFGRSELSWGKPRYWLKLDRICFSWIQFCRFIQVTSSIRYLQICTSYRIESILTVEIWWVFFFLLSQILFETKVISFEYWYCISIFLIRHYWSIFNASHHFFFIYSRTLISLSWIIFLLIHIFLLTLISCLFYIIMGRSRDNLGSATFDMLKIQTETCRNTP